MNLRMRVFRGSRVLAGGSGLLVGCVAFLCMTACGADDNAAPSSNSTNVGSTSGSSGSGGVGGASTSVAAGSGVGGATAVGAGGNGQAGTSSVATGATGGTTGGTTGDSDAGVGGSPADAGKGSDADAAPSDGSKSDASGGDGSSVQLGPKTSLIWVWLGYKTSIDSIVQNAKSFTHVSPALYQVNYAYTSGVTTLVNTNDNFDGLTSSQMATQIHAAGLKIVPLMYGGAGNFGTDQGIQNILNDAPAGTQNNFITSMIGEAVAKKYDGYNLDWEVQGTGYAAYGVKLIKFLTAFKSALNQHGMILTIDLAGWYIRQCSGSGGDGLIDVAAMGHSVDLAILENYAGSLGNASATCPATPAGQTNCDSDFVTQMSVMCSLPKDVVSMGLISTGSNAFAPSALSAVAHFGFTNVAVWPDDAVFLNAKGMPQGSTWYTALADFMSK